MWLSLLDTPCSDLAHYRGIYRCFSAKQLLPPLEEYGVNTGKPLYLPFTDENLTALLELYTLLKSGGWTGELILFGEGRSLRKSDFCLLGYDVCGEGLHYSPIGAGMLSCYDSSEAYADLARGAYQAYCANLNDHGLFEHYPMARAFAEYCEHINRKHPCCIQREQGWRAVAVLRYAPTESAPKHRTCPEGLSHMR